MKSLLILLMAVAATDLRAATGDVFQRFLFPLVVEEHPGAYGTVWTTEAVVRNESDVPLEIFTSECLFRCPFNGCIVTVCLPFQETPPHARFTESLLGRGEIGSVANPASLLYVPAAASDQVVASLRLIEESRRANDFGIEIPVVRESELFTSVLWLADVPMPAGSRTHLRLYGVESQDGGARLRVRAYPGEETTPTLDITIDLFSSNVPPTPMPGDYRPAQPSYLLLLLPPELTTNAMPLRVRVDPITPGLKFWAMASVTSNDTQHVTLVTPQ
jgi:hypothetical protein